MAEAKHELDRDWRVPRIAALQNDVAVIDDTLMHLDDLSSMLEYVHEQEALTECRSFAGRLRALRNDYETEAETLQADLAS